MFLTTIKNRSLSQKEEIIINSEPYEWTILFFLLRNFRPASWKSRNRPPRFYSNTKIMILDIGKLSYHHTFFIFIKKSTFFSSFYRIWSLPFTQGSSVLKTCEHIIAHHIIASIVTQPLPSYIHWIALHWNWYVALTAVCVIISLYRRAPEWDSLCSGLALASLHIWFKLDWFDLNFMRYV